MKNTYSESIVLNKDRKKKREARNFLFSFFENRNLKRIVGLAGPNIRDYLSYCKSKGFKEFVIYENHPATAIFQLSSIKEPVSLKLMDIINADADDPCTLYDLDFCATVRSLKEHISKFKNRFIMTFCCRVSIEETIDTFFKSRGEQVISTFSKETPIKHTIFKTTNGKYVFLTYKDTSPMCCIAKIS